MISKEDYYEHVLENRRLVADPAITRCTCPNTLCDWHGRCKECVALHRDNGNHVPFCLQPILRDKILSLVETVEMTAENKSGRLLEYRKYVKARDREAAAASAASATGQTLQEQDCCQGARSHAPDAREPGPAQGARLSGDPGLCTQPAAVSIPYPHPCPHPCRIRPA